MVIAKKYVLNQHFNGDPKPSDLILVKEKLPALNDGEFLIKAEYLSVAPYIKEYEPELPLGVTMIGFQVAEIIESKCKDFPAGKRVVAFVGWRTYTVLDVKCGGQFHHTPYLLPDLGSLPPSLGLGVLGLTGNTAYFGLIEVCRPKPGETLVISGAAGSVGSHVGQLGKILGLRVIGITSSDARCKWLSAELGFDHVINRKTQDLTEALKEVIPEKIDCYFDTVGGDISNIVLNHMKESGRVSRYGTISTQNTTENNKALPECSIDQLAVVHNNSKMEKIIIFRWQDRWFEGIEQNLQWIKENRLKYCETVTEGFENMFEAFLGMVRGQNIGTAVVKSTIHAGWRSHTVLDMNSCGCFDDVPYLLPDFGTLPASLGLGVLGMPGNTAYFGLIEICQPKAGETLVISGAGGAVGSHVGQIGKILGLKVIGITGSDAKCKWLTEELGFDHAINYKTRDVAQALKEVAPEKVDCYFDNVGGDISNFVISHLNKYARVAICGCISGYNTTDNTAPTSFIDQIALLMTESKMEGFLVYRWQDRWFEGIEQNLQWIKEDKLKYRETVTEGFENLFEAFVGMMQGDNFGKAVVKV